jgi:hypothetical protein
LVFLDG